MVSTLHSNFYWHSLSRTTILELLHTFANLEQANSSVRALVQALEQHPGLGVAHASGEDGSSSSLSVDVYIYFLVQLCP
jgi:hypothetical protein